MYNKTADSANKPSFSRGPSRSGGSRFGSGKPSFGGAKKPSFGGSRFGGGSRGGNRGGGSRFSSQKIDVSRYVNKNAVEVAIVPYVSKHAFADFAIDMRVKKNIGDKGYVHPTPIQDQTIPLILEGKDVVGIANTGTGKTAAFLIPMINKVVLNKNEQMLIVVPTRELATQIDDELKGFSKGLGIFSVCVVGGAPIYRQLKALKYQHHFVIGTPGRIKDLIERKALNLSRFKTVVLDEADRMLDMGFINDMRALMAQMPKDKQTLFFSATMSREVQVLIKDFLNNPVSVSVKTGDTAKSVEQDVVRVEKGKNKIDVLHDMLIKPDFAKVLVFGRTKHGVEKLSKELIGRGFKAESIHGDKNQSRRQRALDLFKKDQLQVLVATDVAARGIDVSDISHVINFDIPATHEDYIHRIGRTGRGNKKGKALTFVD